MASQESFKVKVDRFVHKHPVLVNLIAIFFAAIVLVWLLGVVFLGLWTRHGDTVSVPLVRGLAVETATAALIQGGFEVELDSIYDNAVKPGTVIEQSPREGAIVKDGRTIYLMYACYAPKLVRVPQYYNMSRRQAMAAFEELGLTNITVKEVPSEHTDLVIAAKYNGVTLQPGKAIPAGAAIVLEVGAPLFDESESDGYEELILPEDDDEQFIKDLENEFRGH